ncbi:2-oxoglutarate dehydrogenase complex dihydrolipoyllysine-residue succinyltransferase [Altererythrobacter sp.]|uniref:2-oxoglutarate dehydrogenase complex dihydrolipoyllysine-residue succinyltransferase n=1 Tax=Altererythrobacter sp. TaxID=1872480 RepID=UPI001B185E14|nr:2-oxoglutarate dehydrogenase complex dihydrolipoyllysine-residue succinyltransferase [Altererythrobacter sp.]MBO6609944.1 2-oxoglutarate dehydrogenase complex dihydrolipoyllysine-residue succinyltransferase [Altererythrobacter sp.]MBO6641708.1 2-oxoglutarate dehydrogenase complex dihydrolipoyllysine-residue succinyltransferase [Altererythrobacter sp.]MBO6707593.1 2-oxoglutarate dehydrogenase complex dihydrolipoyllysine-residue succinyltransferase [Altererythrobacter sp.]
MATEVTVPTLGESVTEASVGEWLKQPGDAVAADEPIVSLETDKVAVDVPSPVAGVIGEHKVAVGDTVEVGAVIATIEEGAGAPAKKPEAKEEKPAPAAAKDDTSGGSDTVTMSPAVRRAVLEHGVDPTTIKGTGKDGRLTKEDVLAAAKAKGDSPAPAPAPTPAPATAAPSAGRNTERVKMTRMRQTIAKRLKGAQENAALLTTFNDVDMSAVIEARTKYKDLFAKKHDIRLGFMGFFAKAACLALKDVPSVNAYIEGDEIVYHDYVDISVAVSAPNGLVVPVVRDCQAKGFAQIEKDIADFGKRAKEGTLTMEDMSGGTFTISNGGVFGSLMSTPIINPPQSAVLGLHRIEDRPVAVNGEVVIKPMMYIALSYDHRLIDGREAVTALKIIKEAIEDPTRMLIDL